MPHKHLTDIAIRQLPIPEITTYWWDTQVPAFGVRISPNGLRTFTVIHGKHRRRKSLGRWPDTKLKDARASAQRILLNPAEHATSLTLKEATDTYLETYVKPGYRPRTAYLTERLLTKYTTEISGKRLTTLRPAHFTKIFDDLLPTPSEANHVYGALRAFFGWCEQRNLIAQSPFRKLAKPAKDKSRERTLPEPELRAIWKACPDNYFGAIVKLLMLTGQRRGEIAALQKTWLSDDLITWPPEAVKNGAQHVIPLTPAVTDILATYAKTAGTFLFPARGADGPYNGWGKAKAALDAAIDDAWEKDQTDSPIPGWTLHDLRRTFSTKMAEWEICPPHITEAILNHRTGSRSPIQRIYDRHTYLPQMRSALEAYQERLLQHVLR